MRINKLQASVQGTINRRFRGVDDKFEALHAMLQPTEAVTSLADDAEITEDTNGERELPKTRLGLSETVRSAVMEKWLQGMSFAPEACRVSGCARSARRRVPWALCWTHG